MNAVTRAPYLHNSRSRSCLAVAGQVFWLLEIFERDAFFTTGAFRSA